MANISITSEDADCIYIIRHGFREDWINPAWKENKENKFDDPPLSELGMKQGIKIKTTLIDASAVEVGEALKDSSIRFIFCSPYVRTIQTAQQIAKHKNIKIRLEYGVIEWHGPKQQVNPRSVAELAAMFPPGLIDTEYQSIYPLPNYLESKKLLEERSKQIMKKLSERFTGFGKGAIAIVTHAATAVTLTRGLIESPEAEVRCGVCSIGKMRKNSQNKWIQELNGYSGHLSQGEMYHWEFPEELKKKQKLLQQQGITSTNSLQTQPPDEEDEDD